MRDILKPLLCAVMGVAVAAAAQAAETIKLRLMAPIYVDGKGAGIKHPEGVSCRGKSLLVSDSGNGRLLRYTMTGDTWTPGAEIALPQLPYPIRAEVNSKGEIFALDGKLRRIARLAPTGEFQGYVDPAGEVKGTVVPKSFRIDKDDNLLVLDIFSARVLVLDPSGKFQREIPFPKDYGFLSDLTVDGKGNLFFVDSVQRKVFAAMRNSSGIVAFSESMREQAYFPTAIATDNRGNLYLVDQNGGGVVIIGGDGTFRGRRLSMGWKEGFLRYPSQICISDNGEVFIADRGNNRIESFAIAE
jgi:sugar lactone lactonase YvrE